MIMAWPVILVSLLQGTIRAGSDHITQVTLRIEGIHSQSDGRAIATALSKIPNVKVANSPTTKDPTVIVVPLQGARYDLGDLARVVADTKTPNRPKGAPAAALVLRFETQSAATLERSLEARCAKLRGVEAKESRIDSRKKEIHIRLDGKGGARLEEIKAAFPDLKVDF
jgi:hypothetical protein